MVFILRACFHLNYRHANPVSIKASCSNVIRISAIAVHVYSCGINALRCYCLFLSRALAQRFVTVADSQVIGKGLAAPSSEITGETGSVAQEGMQA